MPRHKRISKHLKQQMPYGIREFIYEFESFRIKRVHYSPYSDNPVRWGTGKTLNEDKIHVTVGRSIGFGMSYHNGKHCSVEDLCCLDTFRNLLKHDRL